MDISKDEFQVEAEIARAWTLPAHLYTDASTFIAEREKKFSRTWRPAEGRGSRNLFRCGYHGWTTASTARSSAPRD